MTALGAGVTATPGDARGRRALRDLAGHAARLGRTRAGLALLVIVVGVAVVGPYVVPHSATAFVGSPFAHPSARSWLGTDSVGRDVVSRFLSGGRALLLLAVLSTLLGVSGGTLVGMVAGYNLRIADEVLMRAMDFLLAFPPIVLALICVSVVGPASWLIILVVGLSHMPQTARVIRSAVLSVRDLDFV
ncbi:MAG: ABC transporter permease, partial [Acidimicrobiales bacterium]